MLIFNVNIIFNSVLFLSESFLLLFDVLCLDIFFFIYVTRIYLCYTNYLCYANVR